MQPTNLTNKSWSAIHLEILHQMIRDEFSDYSGDKSLSENATETINTLLGINLGVSTLKRLLRYDKASNSPGNTTLNSYIKYFNSNDKSPYHNFATEISNWHKFVSYINKNFDDDIKKPVLPPSYDLGASQIDSDQFNEWYKSNSEVIQRIILPQLKAFTTAKTVEVLHRNRTKNIPSNAFVHVTQDYWNSLYIPTERRAEQLIKYYTRLDSKLIPQAVRNDFIVDPEEIYNVIDDDGNSDIKFLDEVLDLAAGGLFSLIKILGPGGMGKSTFLHWIIKKYYNTHNVFIIKPFVENSINDLCLSIAQVSNSKAILILVDNVAAYEYPTLARLIDTIKDYLNNTKRVIFIVSEQKGRFNVSFDQNVFNRFFNNVQLLEFLPPNKLDIFERVYYYLSIDRAELNDPKIKHAAEKIFLDDRISKISQKIYRLLEYLNLKVNLPVKFDWDDWDYFIQRNSEYKNLENLFIAIVCFYQFGFKLPNNFQCRVLSGIDAVTIRRIINRFGFGQSPILIAEDPDKPRAYLYLTNEFVADWYLSDPNRKKLVMAFFQEFLSDINKNSASLFRQMRKIIDTEEYKKSEFHQYLDLNKYLSLLEEYLNLPNLDRIEKVKMQMEKGIIYQNRGLIDKATALFEEIAVANEDNNHARDKLAAIYNEKGMYEHALQKYLEILKNGGVYALVPIYKLLPMIDENKFTAEFKELPTINFDEVYTDFDKIPTYYQYEVIGITIKNKEFDLCKKLLARLKTVNLYTASCYNELAKTMEYNANTIGLKEVYYKKAITISKKYKPEMAYWSHTISYAVFLYRIDMLEESLQVLNNLLSELDETDKTTIEKSYWTHIRDTRKLFLVELPDFEFTDLRKKFLNNKCEAASSFIDFTSTTNEKIIYGYLLLKTVLFHAKSCYPYVYYNALRKLAYCYTRNAHKNWNNLSERDNMIIAERIYDKLMNDECYVNRGDYIHMLKNLQKFNEKSKSLKVLKLTNHLLRQTHFKKDSIFYRYRANVKKDLKNYEEAMKDYNTALMFNKFVKKERDQLNDKAFTLNNMSLLIVQCYEEGYILYNYTLFDALKYIAESIKVRDDLGIFRDLEEKIENLLLKENI